MSGGSSDLSAEWDRPWLRGDTTELGGELGHSGLRNLLASFLAHSLLLASHERKAWEQWWWYRGRLFNRSHELSPGGREAECRASSNFAVLPII